MNKTKIKKSIVRILLGCVVFVILISAFQLYTGYKAEKNYATVQDAYLKKVPRSIKAYPSLKSDAESFETQYDFMIKDDVSAQVVYGPYQISQEATLGVLGCNIIMGEIENFKAEGLSVFDKEIKYQEYARIDIEKNAFDGIPSIANRFNEFNRDSKISYMEYCSINTMLMLFFDHRADLQRDKNLSEIKAKLSE